MQYLINDDPIQVEKAFYVMRFQIARLKTDRNALTQENKQLKNRPETVYDPPPKNLIVKCKKDKIDMDDPVKEWKTPHFLRHFQNLYAEKYGVAFKIAGKSWQAYSFRIAQFRNTHEEVQDNHAYKDMIDWLFKKKFNKRFVASIPLITSDTMLYEWLAVSKGRRGTSPERFREIAANPSTQTRNFIKDAMKDAF
jgi:hypothetical protein